MEELLKFLIGEVAPLTDKTASELEAALITVSESGESTPAFTTKEDLKSFISPLIGNKLKSLQSAKIEEQRGRLIKEAYTKIEADIHEEFGVEGTIKDGLLSKLVDKVRTDSADNPKNIKNHPDYIAMRSEYESKLATAIKDKDETLKASERKIIERDITDKVNSIIEDPENKLLLPQDRAILDNRKKRLVKEILNGELVINKEGEDFVIRNKEGDVEYDDTGLKPLSLKSYALSIAEAAYFEPMTSNSRQPIGVPDKVTGKISESGIIEVGGKSYTLPKFEKGDKAKYQEWKVTKGLEVPSEVVKAVDAIAEKQFSEQT